MTLRTAYLDGMNVNTGTGIVWCFWGSGGTGGMFQECADRFLQESALYLSAPGDLVIRSGMPNPIPSWVYPDLFSSCRQFWCSDCLPGRLGQWIADETSFLASLRERYAVAVISPPSMVAAAAFRQVGFQFLPLDPRSALFWDEKVAMHLALAESGVPRPRTWIADRWSQFVGNGDIPEVVVKAANRRPHVIGIGSVLPHLAPDTSILVEEYHHDALSLNFQFVSRQTDYVETLASIQVVARTSENALMHVGNIRPVSILGSERVRRHARTAHLAATAIQERGYVGLLGIDTFEEQDGAVVVSDVNARMNASAFLAGVPLPSGKVDFFGFGMLPEEHDALEILQSTCLQIHDETDCRMDLCFSPVTVPSTGIAINFRLEAASLFEIVQVAEMLSRKIPGFRSASVEKLSQFSLPHAEFTHI